MNGNETDYEVARILAELVNQKYAGNIYVTYYKLEEKELTMKVTEELQELLSLANVGISWEVLGEKIRVKVTINNLK